MNFQGRDNSWFPNCKEETVVEPNVDTRSLSNVFSRSFQAAYLLTGCSLQAESAMEAAIDLWDPTSDAEERLFQETLRMAVRKQVEMPFDKQPERTTSIILPPELRSVLDLPPKLRYCFVLRILIGLLSLTCGCILRLSAPQVDRYTCWAIKQLSAPHQIFNGTGVEK